MTNRVAGFPTPDHDEGDAAQIRSNTEMVA
jgi:hypothetical protein